MTSFSARVADRGFRLLMKREPASPDELVMRLRRIAAMARLPGGLPVLIRCSARIPMIKPNNLIKSGNNQAIKISFQNSWFFGMV